MTKLIYSFLFTYSVLLTHLQTNHVWLLTNVPNILILVHVNYFDINIITYLRAAARLIDYHLV